MTKDELKAYLVNTEYTEEEVEQMTPFQLVDAYLSSNGIFGYTEDFIDVTLHAFGYLSDSEDIEKILYNN